MKKIVSILILFSLVSVMVLPAFASSDTEFVQKSSFWHWLNDQGGIVSGIVGYGLGRVCVNSDDGYHRSSSYAGTNTFGEYVCKCDYCGHNFTAYESDLKQSYANQVAELPAPGYGSDGSIYVVPTFSVYHLDASELFGPVANGETKSGDSCCLSANLPSIRYELLESSYHSAKTCRYGVSFGYNIPFLCSAELLFSSATYSTSAQSGQLIFVDSFAANYLGEAKTYQANSTFKAILSTSNLSMVKDGNYVLAGNYIYFYLSDLRLKLTPFSSSEFDSIYNVNTRPTSITGGNYGIVGDNGEITTITNNNQIINETNNTYYNPATGETKSILDWSYDYGDRTYSLGLEGNVTVDVRYQFFVPFRLFFIVSPLLLIGSGFCIVVLCFADGDSQRID